MDWIHCNKCFARPCNEVKFEFTSCGHIICSLCKQPDGLCCVCKVNCSTVALSNPIPAQVEFFVTDPINTLKKMKQVVQFQDSNRQKLHSNCLKKAEIMLSEVERKWQSLHRENCYLKSLLSQCKVSTRQTPLNRLTRVQQIMINNGMSINTEKRQITWRHHNH